MEILDAIPFFKEHGWLVMPLYASSVGAVAIVLQKLWQLRHAATVPPAQIAEGSEVLERIIYGEGGAIPIDRSSTLGLILYDCSERLRPSIPLDQLRDEIEKIATRRAREWESYLTALPMIVTLAPLMGLLGTVQGMIIMFDAISKGGLGNPEQLAGGISVALFATRFGLAVAVPVLVMHRWLVSIVKRRAQTLSDALDLWVAQIARRRMGLAKA